MQLNNHQTAIVHIRINWMDYADIFKLMQDRLGMQCHDSDNINEDIVPAVIQAIESDDLDFSELPETGTDAEKHHQEESDLITD